MAMIRGNDGTSTTAMRHGGGSLVDCVTAKAFRCIPDYKKIQRVLRIKWHILSNEATLSLSSIIVTRS